MFDRSSGEMGNKPRRGVAFWEVMVVAVVFAVMAAVAMPAFALFGSGAKSAAKATCQNNLHELGLALQTYWNDYDAVLPSSALVSHSKKWNKTDFLKFATRVGHLSPALDKRQTYCEVLCDYMKVRDIVFCPSDPSSHNIANSRASFWYKLALDKAWFGDGCKRAQKECDFAYTADQIAFYEHDSWHTDSPAGLVNGAQINVVYMDSHVRSIVLKNATSGDPLNCAANSDGEPMWFNFNLDAYKGPSSDTPAKYVDPRTCGDRL